MLGGSELTHHNRHVVRIDCETGVMNERRDRDRRQELIMWFSTGGTVKVGQVTARVSSVCQIPLALAGSEHQG